MLPIRERNLLTDVMDPESSLSEPGDTSTIDSGPRIIWLGVGSYLLRGPRDRDSFRLGFCRNPQELEEFVTDLIDASEAMPYLWEQWWTERSPVPRVSSCSRVKG